MRKAHPQLWALLLQALCMAALGAAAALSALLFGGRLLGAVHGGCIWLLQPVLGAYMGFFAARRGVPAILAWLPAPACFAAAYWLIVGMPPPIGSALVCVLAGVFGAAAGEVWLRRSKN